MSPAIEERVLFASGNKTQKPVCASMPWSLHRAIDRWEYWVIIRDKYC